VDKLLNPTKKLKIFVRRSEIETSGSNLWGLKPISHLLPIANRLFIAILTTLFFEFNDTAFGFPELHLGHQFLPIYFDERNEAVKKLIEDLIKVAHRHGKKVGICGQAPSKYPDYTKFLIDNKIDSISVNPDVFLETKLRVAKLEGL